MPALLKLGSVGPDVAKWKGLLAAAGYPAGSGEVFDELARDQTKAWQASRGIGADGVVGDQSWSTMTGIVTTTGSTDKNAKFGRDVLLAVWPRVLEAAAASDRPEVRELASRGGPNLATLQIAGAQANLESTYGLASYTNKKTGEKSGVINNWGAVQAHGGQKGFETTDTHADGSEYNALYRIYDTPEDGAFDMLREMTIRRPTSWTNMIAGDIDAWSVSMREKDPITGVGLYFEQSSADRAKGIALRVNNIAYTLDEPVAAVRGGPSQDPNGGASAASSLESPAAALSAAPKVLGIGAAIAAIGALAYRYLTGGWPW